MAGIGFSLKRLFNKKGIFNLCKAYGYAGIITTGPMILGVFLLFGMSFVSQMGGLPADDRELLNCMITYSLLVSLLVTSIFNMTVTRFVSDSLYAGKNERVMPSFWGSCSIMIIICVALYGTFLYFSGISFIDMLLCLWLSIILIVVWTEMIYMSALKDYKAIVLSFIISLMIGFLVVLIFVLIGWVSIESMLLGVIISYGILTVRYFKLLEDYFPVSDSSSLIFLRWFDKYKSLAFAGIFVNIGLFGHIVAMYFGPLGKQVKGLFYGAPLYDVPALLAFFSLLITTIGFVTSVEVQFYPKYSNYYGLFNDKGAINDIKLAEKEMRTVLSRELLYLGHKQIFTTILFIVIGPQFIGRIMPGFSTIARGVFQLLCAGYGTYALANSSMLILLYFEDYFGALMGTFVFSLLSVSLSVVQIVYGYNEYYGLPFFIGAIAFYFVSTIRLSWYTRKLPYFLLSRQSIIPNKEKGILTFISRKMELRYDKPAQKLAKKLSKKANVLKKEAGL